MIKPQLLESVKDVESGLAGHDGVLEPKLDGWRMMAHVDKNGHAVLEGRSGTDLTKHLPEIASELEDNLPPDTILDGEAISQEDDWCTVQSVLGGYPKEAEKRSVIRYAVFDLLRFDGHDSASLPYWGRRQTLEKVIDAMERERVQLVPSLDATPEIYAKIVSNGFEGAVLKHKDARYRPGARGAGWYRLKGSPTMDVIAMGFKAGEGVRGNGRGLGAIVFGQIKDGSLTERAQCGTGFTDEEARTIWDNQKRFLGQVFEIRYFGYVGSGVAPRHPSFIRWRIGEKEAGECNWEELQK